MIFDFSTFKEEEKYQSDCLDRIQSIKEQILIIAQSLIIVRFHKYYFNSHWNYESKNVNNQKHPYNRSYFFKLHVNQFFNCALVHYVFVQMLRIDQCSNKEIISWLNIFNIIFENIEILSVHVFTCFPSYYFVKFYFPYYDFKINKWKGNLNQSFSLNIMRSLILLLS